jgi:hypothetical protein
MLTFSRTRLSEQDAARLNAASGGRATAAMAQAATSSLAQKMREVKLAEPNSDTFAIFQRVMAAYPESAALVVRPFFEGYATAIDGITEEA